MITRRKFWVLWCIAMAAIVLLPFGAIVRSRIRRSEQESALAQVQALAAAVATFASNNRDQLPPDIDTLAQYASTSKDKWRSPFGPAADGRGDFAYRRPMRTDGSRVITASEIARPDHEILVVDRAAFVGSLSRPVAVGYADGSVKLLQRQNLKRAIRIVSDGEFDRYFESSGPPVNE